MINLPSSSTESAFIWLVFVNDESTPTTNAFVTVVTPLLDMEPPATTRSAPIVKSSAFSRIPPVTVSSSAISKSPILENLPPSSATVSAVTVPTLVKTSVVASASTVKSVAENVPSLLNVPPVKLKSPATVIFFDAAFVTIPSTSMSPVSVNVPVLESCPEMMSRLSVVQVPALLKMASSTNVPSIKATSVLNSPLLVKVPPVNSKLLPTVSCAFVAFSTSPLTIAMSLTTCNVLAFVRLPNLTSKLSTVSVPSTFKAPLALTATSLKEALPVSSISTKPWLTERSPNV